MKTVRFTARATREIVEREQEMITELKWLSENPEFGGSDLDVLVSYIASLEYRIHQLENANEKTEEL